MEDTQRCPCCKTCKDCPGVQKVVNVKTTGLIIYRYTTCNQDVNSFTVNPDNSREILILHNTKNVDITSKNLIPKLGQYKKCPRCKYILEHAEKLLSNVPKINKLDIFGICNKCRIKDRKGISCCECSEVVKKFIAIKKDEKKEIIAGKQRKFKLQQLLNRVINHDKLCNQFLDKASYKNSEQIRKAQVDQLIEPNKAYYDNNINENKQERLKFSKSVGKIKLIRPDYSDSELVNMDSEISHFKTKKRHRSDESITTKEHYDHTTYIKTNRGKSVKQPSRQMSPLEDSFTSSDKVKNKELSSDNITISSLDLMSDQQVKYIHPSRSDKSPYTAKGHLQIYKDKKSYIKKNITAGILRKSISVTSDLGKGNLKARTDITLSPLSALKNNSEKALPSSMLPETHEPLHKDFSFFFIKETELIKKPIRKHKSSSELIKDTRDMLLQKEAELKKQHEDELKQRLEEKEKKRVTKEEKMRQINERKRITEKENLKESLEKKEPATLKGTEKKILEEGNKLDENKTVEVKEKVSKRTREQQRTPSDKSKKYAYKTESTKDETVDDSKKAQKYKEHQDKEKHLKLEKDQKFNGKDKLKKEEEKQFKSTKDNKELHEKENQLQKLKKDNEKQTKEIEVQLKRIKEEKEIRKKEKEKQLQRPKAEKENNKEEKKEQLIKSKEDKEKQKKEKEEQLKRTKEEKEKVKKEKEEQLKRTKEEKEKVKKEKEEQIQRKTEETELLKKQKEILLQQEAEEKARLKREKEEKEKEKKEREELERKIKEAKKEEETNRQAKEKAKLILKSLQASEIKTESKKTKHDIIAETPTTKELNINQVKMRKPSTDDLILQLVQLKQNAEKQTYRPKRLSEMNISLALIAKHAEHKGPGKVASCIICNNSELQLDIEGILGKTQNTKIGDIIIGQKIVTYKKTPFIEKIDVKKSAPILFTSTYKDVLIDTEPEKNIKGTEEIGRKPPLLSGKYAEQEIPKGVIRYALSDRTFIDKGWTMLPTEKVVRKMNVYRMRPAHPEFDWFEHNKSKKIMYYDCGEKLAEFDDNGRGRLYYRSGRLALDYYDAEEINAQQRFVIHSSGAPDERGRSRPLAILATFDYLGNGIVFDHAGKIRLKYNQTEGVVLDRNIGPVSHWKWHTLNDPPVLQQVMIDTQMAHKDPDILKMGGAGDNKTRPDNEEMLAIEFDNFIKEKSKKLSQKFKPFQIKMKALKINEQFSLKVLDQATIYLIFRDGSTNIKLNIGMILDHQEIVDTDTAEVGEVSNSLEKFPARTDSLAGLQKSIAYAQHVERARVERDRRLRPTQPCISSDKLVAGISRPLRVPLRTAPSDSTTATCGCRRNCRKPLSKTLYYDTRLL